MLEMSVHPFSFNCRLLLIRVMGEGGVGGVLKPVPAERHSWLSALREDDSAEIKSTLVESCDEVFAYVQH